MPKKRRKSPPPNYRLLLIGTLILAVAFWYFKPATAPIGINYIGETTGATTLTLSPGAVSLNPNSESTLTLSINTGDVHVTGAQVELIYDPLKLGTPVVTPGDFLPNVLSAVKVGSGKITFTFAAPPSSGGKTGTGTLATLKIKPSVVGNSSLTFGDTSAVYALGSQANQLKLASDATITVTAPDPEKPAKPTGLRSNCLDNGNKITLRWDSVSGAGSYKLRMNQIDSDDGDKSTDGITSTEYQYSIVPGQKYSWWVHTTKNGVDSEEAKIDEVICTKPAASSTPTPTPTPKPTVKPTPKPTTKPSVKPSPSTIHDPQSTISPNASIIPVENTKSIGSLNDIFKDKNAVTNTSKSSSKPGFFQMLGLGWQAIFSQLAQIFK